MLAKRIIPTILKRGDAMVKGESFNGWRTVGHVEQAARIYQARGVDELCILDIGATAEVRGPDFAAIERLTAHCFMPLTVGGGVRTVDDVKGLLRAGADKVAICSAAWDPVSNLLRDAAAVVGCQALVVAVDVRGGYPAIRNATYPIVVPPVELAQFYETSGAGEILLTNVWHEGTMRGYDLELIRAVSAAVSIPVIAHGGCGTYQHMLEAIAAGADAVAAGAMFQFTDATPKGAAQYLHQHGIEVRQ